MRGKSYPSDNGWPKCDYHKTILTRKWHFRVEDVFLLMSQQVGNKSHPDQVYTFSNHVRCEKLVSKKPCLSMNVRLLSRISSRLYTFMGKIMLVRICGVRAYSPKEEQYGFSINLEIWGLESCGSYRKHLFIDLPRTFNAVAVCVRVFSKTML